MTKDNYYIGYGAKNNGIISKEKEKRIYEELNDNKKILVKYKLLKK